MGLWINQTFFESTQHRNASMSIWLIGLAVNGKVQFFGGFFNILNIWHVLWVSYRTDWHWTKHDQKSSLSLCLRWPKNEIWHVIMYMYNKRPMGLTDTRVLHNKKLNLDVLSCWWLFLIFIWKLWPIFLVTKI